MFELKSNRALSLVAFLAWALLLPGPSPAEAPPVTATYLANEGILLASGDDKVLVDALFPGIRNYPSVPEEVRSELLAGHPPFDGIDVILATHHHRDHFGPTEALAFMRASGDSVLVSTPQALRLMRVNGDIAPELDRRLHAYYPAEGDSLSFRAGAISIEILNLHHGRDRRPLVENLGFVIDFDGFRILHVGDTEASLDEFARYDLAARRIDLALVPGWFLAEPEWARITRSLAPRALVAMHLAEPGAPRSWFGSAGSLAKRKDLIREAFPEAWIPDEALQTRDFPRTSAER